MAGIGDSFFRGGNPNDFVIDINPSGVTDFFQPDKAGIGAIDIPISFGGDTVEDQEKFLYNDSFLNNKNKKNINKEDLSAFEASKQTTTPFDANFIVPPTGPDHLEHIAALQDSLSGKKYGQPGKGAPNVITGSMKEGIPEKVKTETPEETALVEGLDSFIEGVRGTGAPAPEVKSLEEYKQLLSDITGVDMSGKVDKSAALMSFGLALMQNRAGKGFNLGRMMRSVGEAGEVALPKLEAAKKEARAAAIEGGKFALTSQRADAASARAAEEKSMVRNKYWIYEKGGKGQEFANFDRGEFADLSMYEMNKLLSDPEFEKKYEFINAADRMSILEKRAEALNVDTGDQWGDYKPVSMIGGDASKGEVAPELMIFAAPADPNYKGTSTGRYKLEETKESVIGRFISYQENISSGAEKFKGLISAIDSGVSIPSQMIGSVWQGLRNLGLDIGDQPPDVSKARLELKRIAVREATNILQESGKTLSDNDRKRVSDLVGEISFMSADADLIKSKLKEIYELTVIKPQKNLDRAVEWLDDNVGISFSPKSLDTPENKEELAELNKMFGTNLTMDDFK